MASKSKKRRRVLGASCILAALIIAGSSFAWFTSKDEVTNRLTASSDYGVSIVESFTPPKNWLPGETVDKDVYAVNTGTIDAFVKENVEGKLNYTYEEIVTAFSADNVKLTVAQVEAIQGTPTNADTEDGINTYEAGGYLAWTDAAGVDAGSINAGRTLDGVNPWKPTVEGAYVFRRSITGDATNPFTYAGYYYVPANGTTAEAYYKIILGSDAYPTGAKDAAGNYVFNIYADAKDIATVNDTNFDLKDGDIKAVVPYKFIAEKEVKDQTVTFKYEDASTTAGSEHPARLVVEYVGAKKDADEMYNAQADAARKQVAYQNAKGEYEAAVASLTNALANYTYGTELTNAENKLYAALVDLQAKKDALDTAASEYATAQGNVNKWAKAMQDGTDAGTLTGFKANGVLNKTGDSDTVLNDLQDGKDALNPTTDASAAGIFPSEVREALTGVPAGNPYVTALSDHESAFYKAYTAYNTLYNDVYATNGLYDQINGLLTEIQDLSNSTNLHTSNDDAADEAKTKINTLKTTVATLVGKLTSMKNAYTNLVNATNEVTGMDLGDSTAPAINALDTMIQVAKDFKDNTTALDGLVDTYVDKEDAYNTAQLEYDTASNDWSDAIDTYQSEVTAAQTKYNNSLNAIHNGDGGTGTAWDSNNIKHEKEDRSTTVVPAYSARTADETSDPKFTTQEVNSLKAYTGAVDNNSNPDPAFPAGVSIRQLTLPTEANDFGVKDFIEVEEDARNTVTAETSIADWRTKVNNYKSAMDAAQNEYNDAQAILDVAAQTGGAIKMYVNLADGYNQYWQFDGANNDTTDNAEFYYKKVLLAGQTSEKLIDSVEFDKDVTPASYKNLTFDLNVGLDSAQVTYDDNQRLYETDAVDGNDNFKLKITDPTTAFAADQILTWGTPTTP